MRARRWGSGAAVVAAAACLTGGASALVSSSAPQNAVRLGTSAALPRHASYGGPLAARRSLHLTVELKSHDADGLARFARAVSTPGFAEYRHFLTVSQFAQRFGAGAEALHTTASALRHAGLRVGTPAANGLSLPVSGSVAAIDHALHTRVDAVRLADGASAFGNRAAPLIPAAAAPYVQGVFGLDDLDVTAHQTVSDPVAQIRRARPAAGAPAPHIVTGGPQPCATATHTATATFAGSTGNLAYRSGYTADELASVYGFTPLYQANDLGAGQTVALVEEGPYTPSDVATFQQCYGTSASVTDVDVNGGLGASPTPGDESTLDIEAITALAPLANVLVYQGTNQMAIITQMVSDNRAQVISSSWASCEGANASLASSYQTLLQEAAVQGQSMFASSGDHGSECGTALKTQLPASDPYATAVGGTSLYSVTSGGTPEPFAAGRVPVESVWNNGVGSTSAVGGGGGLSAFSAMPAYQSSAPASLGVIGPDAGGSCGAADCREVPDVSADADGGTGYVIYSQGVWKVLGGTSFAAPLWGAFAALTNASAACGGVKLGFANPLLYQLAGGSTYGTLFNDIVTASPRTGAANNDAAGTNGGLYGLRTGYDMATGLGSMHGGPLSAALCQAAGAATQAVALTNPGAQSTTVGTAITLKLQGSDSTGLPLTYSGTGLPPGLALTADGVISGAPTTPGTYTVDVRAVDAAANHATLEFTWTVSAATNTITTPPTPSPPTVARARLSGIRQGRPKLHLTLDAGSGAPAIGAVTLALPHGIAFARQPRQLRAGISASTSVRGDDVTAVRQGTRVVLRFAPATTSVTIALKGPAITARPRLVGRVRRHKVHQLRMSVTVTDALSTATRLGVSFRL